MSDELWDAAEKGDSAKVERLLSNSSIDVNFRGPRKDTPLIIAARKGHLQVVERLVKDPRVDRNAENVMNFPAFNIACQEGHYEIVVFLSKVPKINLNRVTASADTPLASAFLSGSKEIIQYLKNLKAQTTSTENQIRFIIENLAPSSTQFLTAIGLLLENLLIDVKVRQAILEAKILDMMVQNFKSYSSEQVHYSNRLIYRVIGIDSIKNHILRLNGYAELARANSRCGWTARNLGSFAFTLRSIQTRNAMVSGFPQIIDDVTETMKTSAVVGAPAIILALTGLPNSPPGKDGLATIAASRLLETLQPDDRSNATLDALQNLAAMDNARGFLVKQGASRKLEPLTEDLSAPRGLAACLIIALLSASESEQASQVGNQIKPTPDRIVKKVVETMNIIANTLTRKVNTTPGFSADAQIILKAVSSLISNEGNINLLKELKVAEVIVTFLRNRKQDLLDDDFDCLQQAICVVWCLAFHEEIRQALLTAGIVDLIRSFVVVDHEGAKDVIDKALFTLRPPTSHVSLERTPSSSLLISPQIMISYCWAQKQRMRELAAYLKAQGFNIWIGIEQMEGSVLEAMASAIESSSLIIIGLSSHYKESQACRTEAEYAYKLKKQILYVMAEDSYGPNGWLGALLGSKLWYKPWNSTQALEPEEVVKQIQKLFSDRGVTQAVSSSISQHPPPPPAATLASVSAPKSTSQSKEREIAAWKNEQVLNWLSIVDLKSIGSIAKENGWNGRVLVGMHLVLRDMAFIQHCKDEGIDTVKEQTEFRTELKFLFE